MLIVLSLSRPQSLPSGAKRVHLFSLPIPPAPAVRVKREDDWGRVRSGGALKFVRTGPVDRFGGKTNSTINHDYSVRSVCSAMVCSAGKVSRKKKLIFYFQNDRTGPACQT